ncbi:MAG: hypothetical protein ACR2NL_01620 [Acidimicrobiia bacterium]
MGDMTRKMVDHPSLEPGESVIEAVWGLGKGFLRAADIAGGLGNTLVGKASYADQHEQSVEGRDESGFGGLVDGNGVLALTNRRLLFYKKATVRGTPKAVTAAIDATRVSGADYNKPMLTITFDDGSATGLHVPRNQGPDAFVQAIAGSGRDG